MKILVVDDSNLMVSIIGNFIRKAYPDAQIVEGHNGQEAIDRFEAENPNLVFLDVKMPIKDGFQALEEIKAKHPAAKIVMCTSLKETEQEERAKKLGAVGYIMKPFSSEDIHNAIRQNT